MENEKRRIKTEDKVKVIAGKDKGKIGKVIRVDKKKNRVQVENVNMIKRHLRPGPQNRQGGIVESEGLIHSSNVMLICNKCVAPVRTRHKVLEDGKKVRVCAKCNESIDA
ncbi:MAG: 50S ribosomal protein L24 [Thermodesulfobacteriota bacterium]